MSNIYIIFVLGGCFQGVGVHGMEFFVFLFMIVMFLTRGWGTWDIHLRGITPKDLLCNITIVFFSIDTRTTTKSCVL